MPAVYCKYQKCGKSNCRCHTGALHGPYFWLINYQRKTGSKKAKYRWIYLGKTPETAFNRLHEYYGSKITTNFLYKHVSEENTEKMIKETIELAKSKASQRMTNSGAKSAIIKIAEVNERR